LKHKSIILIILLGLILVCCTEDEEYGSSNKLIQILFYSADSQALSIDMFEINIFERPVSGERTTTISPEDFNFDDQSNIYIAESSI